MQNLTIVKVGGKVAENEVSLKKLLVDFSNMNGLKLLVHGGGNIASEMAEKLGLEVKMVNGRRITDDEMLKLVTMVYGGLVNKNIVSGLQKHKCNAVGLSGADLNIISAVKRPVNDIDFGFVGDIVKVNGDALKTLIENKFIPVIAPLTHDNNGQILNTNADDITNAIARELSKYFEIKLIFCFDKKGVMTDQDDDNTVIEKLDKIKFKELVQKNIINEGMIPKLENGFQSLEFGVEKVLITDVDSFANDIPGGTELVF
ncbi:acetylglutamate kinase [Bacteroidota bacterium]